MPPVGGDTQGGRVFLLPGAIYPIRGEMVSISYQKVQRAAYRFSGLPRLVFLRYIPESISQAIYCREKVLISRFFMSVSVGEQGGNGFILLIAVIY